MITFTRTAVLPPEAAAQGMERPRRLAEAVEAKTGHKVASSMQVGGDPYRIVQSTTHPDLGEFETGWPSLWAIPST